MKLPLLAYVTQLVLLAGTTLLLVFIVLSGSIEHSPINKFYWIEADTSNIAGAPDISRWTFWGLAQKENGSSVQADLSPGYPFSPVDNFGTTVNVPQSFISNRSAFYYLSRFAFAFYWITLAFVGVSLILSCFVVCSNSIIKINGWLISAGLLFGAGATAFETAISVMGRSAFHSENKYAHLGVALLAISWAAVACLIILFFLSWGSFCVAGYRAHKAREAKEEGTDNPPVEYDAPRQSQTAGLDEGFAQPPAQQTHDTGIKFFKIRRHNDQESV